MFLYFAEKLLLSSAPVSVTLIKKKDEKKMTKMEILDSRKRGNASASSQPYCDV